MKTTTEPKPDIFFIFDVESIGLHGEGYAVAGGVYNHHGKPEREFRFACDPKQARGRESDRDWVAANVPPIKATHGFPRGIREAFWVQWTLAKNQYPGIIMAVECGWPVEARFLADCVDEAPEERCFEGPYPLHEIASYMSAAGMDPMETYERLPHELPAHDPSADARLSARLLATAMKMDEGEEEES